MAFQIFGLDYEPFAELFTLSEAALAERGAMRRVADAKPGFPCRVSLVDAEVGETVVLLNFEHLSVASPFRSRHAIYVRQGAQPAILARDEVPALLRSRWLSVRAFDAQDMLVAAEIIVGTDVERVIRTMLDDDGVRYLHLHYAKPGCYAARVERVVG